ncbi:hypothetical protein KCP70_07600 [Salmonella enterica subsp. enterica]|nr:hypothetical protein KCP70_07600 [Salmonella enterica subsp. enterica]
MQNLRHQHRANPRQLFPKSCGRFRAFYSGSGALTPIASMPYCCVTRSPLIMKCLREHRNTAFRQTLFRARTAGQRGESRHNAKMAASGAPLYKARPCCITPERFIVYFCHYRRLLTSASASA